MAHPSTGTHSCIISMWVLCALRAGRCWSQPWSAVPAGPASISGSAAAVAQCCLGPMALPAGVEQALHAPGAPVPWGQLAGQTRQAPAPVLCIWLPCLAVQSGVMQAASVQEQPLLKQNNLQKYRYSPCPRPDLAKEEQGSCPGQGLAQPHGAFGHGGARPVPSLRVTLLLLTASVAPTGRGSLPAERAAAPVLSWARAHGGAEADPAEELQAPR